MKFDCGGDKFFMAMEEKISVHEAEDAKIVCELENRKRVLCAAPSEVGLLVLIAFLFLLLTIEGLFWFPASYCKYNIIFMTEWCFIYRR